jgi:prepilin-type processing-associated H-X9-DG protein
MHGSYRANSGKASANGEGFWDTFEPYYWPNNTIDRSSRGPLHGTGSAYNGIPAPSYIEPTTKMPVSGMGGPERFTNIIDGLSNTFMVGEFTLDNPITTDGSGENRGTFWAYTYASYNQSSFSAQSRIFGTDYDKCYRSPGVGEDNPCKRGWGSNHNNGINFCMCDGSVRWVSYSADVNVLMAMATIAGGEVAQLLE